jgi:hypothetical protein
MERPVQKAQEQKDHDKERKALIQGSYVCFFDK